MAGTRSIAAATTAHKPGCHQGKLQGPVRWSERRARARSLRVGTQPAFAVQCLAVYWPLLFLSCLAERERLWLPRRAIVGMPT